MQQSRIESRFSTRFSIFDSCEDRESSVNLLLNGTVHLYTTVYEDVVSTSKVLYL